MRGEWKEAMTMHAFAPLLLFILIIIAVCTLGPRRQVDWIVTRTEVIERHTGITTLLLGGLILYWLARLLILQTAFVRLIQG
jgi:hypothetical protein